MSKALSVESNPEVRYSKSQRPGAKGVTAKITSDGGKREIRELENCHSLPPNSEQKRLGVSTDKRSESHDTGASDNSCIPPEISIGNRSELGGSSFQAGDRVEAKYRGRGHRYYKGTIAVMQPDGLYSINYDDGDKDVGLSEEFIRSLANNTSEKQVEQKKKKMHLADAVSEPIREANDRRVFGVGQKVEAKYRNRGRRWYKGTIVGVLPNDLYNIKYDDGDEDKKLPVGAIRTKESFIRTVLDSNERRSGVNTKSPTNVKVVGSESECELSAQAIKSLEKTAEDKKSDEASKRCAGFQRGQIVESRYKGRGRRWYKGTVTECFSNGTYNIQYADGDKDFDLAAKYIRALGAPNNEKVVITPHCEAEGSKVETPKIKGDGNERSPDSSQNESISTGSLANKAKYGEGHKNIESVFNEGDKVEAKFRGRGSRWYNGTIVACVPDGTYTVQYDDGDKDSRLPASAIRAVTREVKARKVESPPDVDVTWLKQPGKEVVAETSIPISKEKALRVMVGEELSQVEDVVSEDIKSVRNEKSIQQHHSYTTSHAGKGNRLYRGVVSKVKVMYLYEVKYEDGTKDVNIPFEALQTREGATGGDVKVGSPVDVLSWQDRFWSSNR